MKTITVKTEKSQQILDITEEVKRIVKDSETKEGFCLVYSPHATCSIMINENWDPNIMLDIIDSLDKLVPKGMWRHDKVDNNGSAHIKASIIGPSEMIPVKDGKLLLGRWQDIMLADFDGPKERKVMIDVRQ